MDAQNGATALKQGRKFPARKQSQSVVRTAFEADNYRPWLKNYPEGIEWDIPINITPVHQRVLESCQQYPDANALDFLGAKTTFSRLSNQIEAFAGALQNELGVKKGDRVAIMLPNTPFFPVAYYAALSIGATIVNCNPLYSIDELSHIISDSKAKIMVTMDLQMVFEKAEKLCENGLLNHLIVANFPSALPLSKRVLFSLFKRSDLANVARSPQAHQILSFQDFLRSGHTFSPVQINPLSDIAVQQYTGGTTGEPKGALLSHANIAANLSQLEIWGCEFFFPPSKVIAVLPFFHIFGMTVCMNIPLANGLEVAMLPRFDLKSFLALMERTKANILPAVPTLLNALSAARGKNADAINSIDIVVAGGAPMVVETREKFNKVCTARIMEGYGLTECSPVVCCEAVHGEAKPLSIGMPIPGTDVVFLDLEDPTQQVPPGEKGELAVRAPQTMREYYNRPEQTQEAIINDYFRTGDVGYVDEDGYVFLVDRIKDLVICNGFNVYPRSIEEMLHHHEAVDECNVIGVKDRKVGEVPIAFVKLREGKSADEKELKSYLRAKLAKYEVPREIIFKDELPKTLIGKLSKIELREEYAQRKEKAAQKS